MKRIRIIAICTSLLATLSMVGCVCTPGYYSGMPRYAFHSSNFGTECDPCGPSEMGCGPVDCGVIEYGGNFCAPPRIANCRASLSHIGNGICLVGRGVLDIVAVPFVAVGGVLSSGCRYEVIAHCDTPCYTSGYSIQADPCGPSGFSCASGCETCAGGYTEGIQYDTNDYNTNVLKRPPTFPSRRNTVVQAGYQEPTVPTAKFVRPK